MSSPNPYHHVDPELRSLLDVVPTVTLSNDNLAAIRSQSRLPIPQPEASSASVQMSVRKIPGAAPAPAADLAGLPPTYIATGGLDLFLEEDLDYAGG